MLKKQSGCTVRFGHVPRAFNSVADWAGNVAREVQKDIDLISICVGAHVAGPPPLSVGEAVRLLEV